MIDPDISQIVWDDDATAAIVPTPIAAEELKEAFDLVVSMSMGSECDRKELRWALNAYGLKVATC